MKRVLMSVCLLAALWLAFAAAPVWAESPVSQGKTQMLSDYLSNIGRNVRLTLTIVDSDPGTRPEQRSYEYVGRDNAQASLVMGWRVPIPTTREKVGENADPITEYVYQNIGFTARLIIHILEDERILIRGDIETSGARQGPEEMREAAKDDMPIIGTFQQDIDVTLKEGKPLRVAEVPDPEGGRVHLEIKAEVLD